jgi:hypothetical protein
MNEFDQDRRMIPYARFPIGNTFPSPRGKTLLEGRSQLM